MKSIIIFPTILFMYSGRTEVIKGFLEFIYRDINPEKKYDFISACKYYDYAVRKLDQEHFVFHQITFTSADNNITGTYSSAWRMFEATHNRAQFYTAGSGTDDLVDRLTIDDPESEQDLRIHPWMTRMAAGIVQEMTDGTPLAQGYGGWYEILTQRDGAFEKVPYSVIFWKVFPDGRIGLSGPIIGSRYYGNSLCINRINLDDGHHRHSINWLPDPLKRDMPNQITALTKEILKNRIHIHVLFKNDGDTSIAMYVDQPQLKMLRLRKVGDKLIIEHDLPLIEELMASAARKGGIFVSIPDSE